MLSGAGIAHVGRALVHRRHRGGDQRRRERRPRRGDRSHVRGGARRRIPSRARRRHRRSGGAAGGGHRGEIEAAGIGTDRGRAGGDTTTAWADPPRTEPARPEPAEPPVSTADDPVAGARRDPSRGDGGRRSAGARPVESRAAPPPVTSPTTRSTTRPRRRDHPAPACAGRAPRRRDATGGFGRRREPGRRELLVDAKLCPDGHPNPPVVASCAVCGQFLTPGASAVVHVPRPSLGHLELDDGTIVELDHELLVGRNPDGDEHPERAGLPPGQGGRRQGVTQPPRGPLPGVGRPGRRLRVDERHVRRAAIRVDRSRRSNPAGPSSLEPGATVYFGSRSFTVVGRESNEE